ncbi:MAG: DegT/DnrJ/EryC1/StrS family aminotransferase [Maioricimonas sp. JB045]
MSNVILPLTGPQSSRPPVPLIDLVEQYETIQGEIRDAVERVFATQRFVLGDEVAEFECDVAAFCDARFAIGCASGSDALLLAMMALDIGPGDEVITSPYTFFATGSAIHRTGARPVFVDIDPKTFNLCPKAVEAAITPRTRAIMPVHLFGQCADMEPLWRCAVKNGLAIVEDAAQAIGASYRGRRAGVLGTMGCFSFFPTKNLGGAGDGGMITTDDPDLAARLGRLRVHGDAGRYEHLEVGINSRLDALQAAVLSVKLRHLDDWAEQRRENAARYEQLFRDHRLTDVVELPETARDCTHVYNQYCVRVRDGLRDDVLATLRREQVGSAIYYPKPLHLQECFRTLGYAAGDFPESERASAETIALPIYPELGAERQAIVVETFAQAVAGARSRVIPAADSHRRAA